MLLDLLLSLALFQHFPVRIDLKPHLFSVGSDDDLIIPSAIRVIFPFDLNDLSPGCLLINCLLDRGGKGFYVDLFSGLFRGLR